MVGEISTATRIEVLGGIRSRYREAAKRDKSRMLDEFVAIAGCHRKHAVRLLAQCEDGADRVSIARTYGPVVARVNEPPCGPVDGLLSPLGLLLFYDYVTD